MIVRVLSVLLLAPVAALAGSSEHPRGKMVGAVAAPGEIPVVSLHAEGAQLYECKADADGKLVWTFREPIAALLQNGRTVGRHYAGPTWENVDGSAVTGKVVGSIPGRTTNDVALLKLEVVSHRGDGVLTPATTVQRLNTIGGALAGPCETASALRAVPYSADYVFLRKSG
jgi:hypothetical protein